MSAALWLPLTPARKLVLVALCDRADINGYCWPSRADIAIRASLTVRSVTPHLQGLEADGWLISQKGNRAIGQTTRRRINVNRVLIESRVIHESWRLNLLGEDSSRDQISGEVDGIDQGKLTAFSGEAASRVIVNKPSEESSPILELGLVAEKVDKKSITTSYIQEQQMLHPNVNIQEIYDDAKNRSTWKGYVNKRVALAKRIAWAEEKLGSRFESSVRRPMVVTAPKGIARL